MSNTTSEPTSESAYEKSYETMSNTTFDTTYEPASFLISILSFFLHKICQVTIYILKNKFKRHMLHSDLILEFVLIDRAKVISY